MFIVIQKLLTIIKKLETFHLCFHSIIVYTQCNFQNIWLHLIYLFQDYIVPFKSFNLGHIFVLTIGGNAYRLEYGAKPGLLCYINIL